MGNISLQCDWCKTPFERRVADYNKSIRSGKTKFFCCSKCSTNYGHSIRSDKVVPVDRLCLWCGTQFRSTSSKKHKLCCSTLCAKKYSSSKVDPKNISKSMKKRSMKICPNCGKEFDSKSKSCSMSCASILRWNSKEYREKTLRSMRIGIENSVKNKTWNVWRKRIGKSYPEKFFESILIKNNISFESEFSVGRFSIDFALLDKKIALEIDGQQHSRPQYVESDKRKDELLSSLGWRVYRIKWKGHATESTRLKTDEDIKSFLEFYNSV